MGIESRTEQGIVDIPAYERARVSSAHAARDFQGSIWGLYVDFGFPRLPSYFRSCILWIVSQVRYLKPANAGIDADRNNNSYNSP